MRGMLIGPQRWLNLDNVAEIRQEGARVLVTTAGGAVLTVTGHEAETLWQDLARLHDDDAEIRFRRYMKATRGEDGR